MEYIILLYLLCQGKVLGLIWIKLFLYLETWEINMRS